MTGPRIPALILWSCTGLFDARAAGQAIQFWFPTALLPPFERFQGSDLPYGALLAIQLVTLSAMAVASNRASEGRLALDARARRVLGWIGAIYMGYPLGVSSSDSSSPPRRPGSPPGFPPRCTS